jgi:hypothetical protein
VNSTSLIQEITMTIEIRRFAMQVMTDRSLARWLALAVVLVAALALNAPIGGGTGV